MSPDRSQQMHYELTSSDRSQKRVNKSSKAPLCHRSRPQRQRASSRNLFICDDSVVDNAKRNNEQCSTDAGNTDRSSHEISGSREVHQRQRSQPVERSVKERRSEYGSSADGQVRVDGCYRNRCGGHNEHPHNRCVGKVVTLKDNRHMPDAPDCSSEDREIPKSERSEFRE
jgi:hypothetical protein